MPDQTYFNLFGLAQTFSLDLHALEASYRRVALELHPDRIGALSSQEKTDALLRAAEFNQAYKTLKNEKLRARYLLGLYGVHTKSEAAVANPEFLAQVMELQESVAEAKALKNQGQIDQILAHIRQLVKKTHHRMAGQFSLLEQGDRGVVSSLLDDLSGLHFYDRLLQELLKESF